MSGSDDDDGDKESPQSKSRNLLRSVFGPSFGSFNSLQTPKKDSSTLVGPQGRVFVTPISRQTFKNPSGIELQARTQLKRERIPDTPSEIVNNVPAESKRICIPRSPSSEQWQEYASMLSPPPCQYQKPPLPRQTTCLNESLRRPTCRFTFPDPFPALDCTCIACAGVLAKPEITPCLVCGESIPYSVCSKRIPFTTKPRPIMCFECKSAFQ